ncbi:Agamous-like MADS-box protein tm6 [Ancistrocladus abbreviatus]
MGRGKIEIKRIENRTNRQVTYSKRRNGIFKKAQELTVLCDAKVSLIMFSSTDKMHEYVSPNITTKKMYDQYQKTLGVDIWSTHYERMQEQLRKLKEINSKLRRDISDRIGGDLEHLGLDELCELQQSIAHSLDIVRNRKYHVIKTQTNTCRKKVKSLEQRHGHLLLNLETKYGLVECEGDYESAGAYGNGATNLFALSLHSHLPNLQHRGDYAGHDLRLA